jgi:hypothetical protein
VQVQHVEQDVSDILSLGKEHVLNNMLKQDVPNMCVGHLAPEQLDKDSNLSKACVSFRVCYRARICDCELIKGWITNFVIKPMC